MLALLTVLSLSSTSALAQNQEATSRPEPPTVNETVTVTAPSPYGAAETTTATKTATALIDVPQSVTVVTRELIRDQLMLSVADVVRYIPGISAHQGENNRDQIIMRGNSSSADFFVDGVRDDLQYYRDLYNVERVEALKGPNAMIFGRGGGGGVINRVLKRALPGRHLDFVAQTGTFGHKRVAADVNLSLTPRVAFRMNALFESSDSFREGVGLERYGLSPTVTVTAGSLTDIIFAYEHFDDARTADRGVPSFEGRPSTPNVSTFFGDPSRSRVNARVDLASATLEHRFGGATLRSRTSVGDFDRSYQNFVPGAVTSDRQRVSVSAYNNATQRLSLFNQTDLTGTRRFGRQQHSWLVGAELGSQRSDNFRNSGFFNDAASSVLVSYEDPLVRTPVTFRQSATDANNRVRAGIAAVFAQDQVQFSRRVHLTGGLRIDRFEVRLHNNRNGDDFARGDTLVSPRVGFVIKPAATVSLYGSRTLSYLPSSGDQFASVTAVTEHLKPEKFTNHEVGLKWDIRTALSLTMAAYRLDRTNTRATDPDDATRVVQTGAQRTNGYELGVNGRLIAAWQIAGGYAYQHAVVTRATTAAPAGAQVAQVPRHTLSLWNMCRFHPRVGAGLGLVRRSDVFASIDNRVTLPGYTTADAAIYVFLSRALRLQVNVDNVFDRRYYANADNNTNISPGAPRSVKVGLTAGF